MKHRKIFKAFTVFICIVMTVVGARTDVFATAVNITTTYTCPRGLCSKKLIIDGPYGNPTDVINSSVPYLGGKTFSDAYALYLPNSSQIQQYHLYIIYCPKYDNSDSSILRHTMTMMFSHHGYTITGYSQYNASQHYVNKICNHSTDFRGSHLYSLSQELCGENSMIATEDLEALAEDYQANTGCGLEYSELDSHTFTFGDLESSGSSYHIQKKTCSLCGYTTNVYQSHSFTYNNYSSVNSQMHSYKRTCSICGYSDTVTASHSFTYGNWTKVDSFYHKRNKTCSDCLYNENETASHRDNNADNICDDCGYVMPVFSVTVPTSLNLVMSEDGTVYTPDNVKIENNSNAAVKVTAIEITGKNDWTVTSYSTNMANEKVNCKKIGFKLNDTETNESGKLILDDNWSIDTGSEVVLNYDAVISATSSPIINENIADIKFTVEWSD